MTAKRQRRWEGATRRGIGRVGDLAFQHGALSPTLSVLKRIAETLKVPVIDLLK